MFRRDYKQAEAMVVAWLAEDLQQISDFSDGADIHCRTVQILYDCDYQQAVDGYRNKEPEWILRRNLGKPVRHGFNYKLGEQGLRRQFIMMDMDVPTKECRRLLQAMASNVPAVGRWQAEVEETVRLTRRLVNPFGLSRTFLGIIDADVIREATAFVPQSTVGQMLNLALRRIYQRPEIMTSVDFLLQIHDAILAQAPIDELQKWATLVGELMLMPLTIKGRELVIETDCDCGPSWGDLKPAKWEKEPMPVKVAERVEKVMKSWDIWSEGYMATCQSADATFHGSAMGSTFQEACDNFAASHPSFASDYNPKQLTLWGCSLYDNESAARRSFG
jgi:DNA polymerase I-like protein with 3'-5' exonuclease and polymerase domains